MVATKNKSKRSKNKGSLKAQWQRACAAERILDDVFDEVLRIWRNPRLGFHEKRPRILAITTKAIPEVERLLGE